ncbi:serine protease [Lichtheimia corymbifera JMRC:FSU:9682]|uniref:Serine protease n=1 Tax=Lichtheimia corymbifera JMRC:FSU:9682 TaxID=1263082 RepID=A0A068SDD6_9FUNG|nr:serine protease [Lichtheimia corymbifera JMRC:FSU:9682]
MKLSIAAGFLLFATSSMAAAVPFHFSDDDGYAAPLYVSSESESVTDQYIVVLKNHIQPQRVQEHTGWVQSMTASRGQSLLESWLHPDSIGIRHVYDMPNLKGYAGTFGQDVLEMIRRSEDVAFVEKNSMVYTSELQRNAPWGLARISHRDRLSLSDFNKYSYDAKAAGKDVKVYVIDTGINVDHVDFEGRAKWGQTVPSGDEDEDGNGHGSHCAGTIAGKKYGVAKKASPVAVKVLRSNGSGTMADVVRGVDWATEQHTKDSIQAKKTGKTYKGSVANMSLGGGKSPSLDLAVNGAVDAGMVFAVAAGNDNRDACDYSPAAAENAITVGASTLYDTRAYFSNYGKCVDVFAPGLNIQSVWKGSKYATNTISGTSMASPHVAGLAAYFLSMTDGGASPKEIKDKILEMASKDKLSSIPSDTPNLLIFNGAE